LPPSKEYSNALYHPGLAERFLEILQKNAETQLTVGLLIKDDVLALQRAMALGSRSSLAPVMLEPFTLSYYCIFGRNFQKVGSR